MLPAVPRLVAIGDVHGDLDKTRRAFRLAGATDESDRWIGGQLVVVQVLPLSLPPVFVAAPVLCLLLSSPGIALPSPVAAAFPLGGPCTIALSL